MTPFDSYVSCCGCVNNEDVIWGYVCDGHIDKTEFAHQMNGYSGFDNFNPDNAEHAFVSWRGFGGWCHCKSSDKGARPVTFYTNECQTYAEFLEDTPNES